MWIAVNEFQEKTQECSTSWVLRSHATQLVYSPFEYMCLRIAEHFRVRRQRPREGPSCATPLPEGISTTAPLLPSGGGVSP